MRRCDGRMLRSIGPFVKMIPYIMTRRSDAQNFGKQVIVTDNIDAYIKEKREQGHNINYMHIFISAYIRIIAERPQLNRFVINNRLYARNGIFVSMAIKRSLHDEGEETTVKFAFTGRENIFEIVEIINKTIADSAPAGSKNAADRIAEGIMSLPNPLVNALVGVLKGMDRHNLLPGSIVEASPFHTTLFFTYLKSIKLDYIYHHLYDFGTTGIFAALGKVKKMPVVEGDQMVVRRCCEVGYTMDERLCDGLYFANSIKLAKRYLENPYLLEAGLIDIVKDVL